MSNYKYCVFSHFPRHWEVHQFAKVILDKSSGNVKIKQSDYLESGVLPVIDQGKALIGGYIDNKSLRANINNDCILFGDHTKTIKYVDFKFALGADGVKVLVPSQKLDVKFAYYYLKSLKLPDNAGYSRHFKFLKECVVPVPPLEEQKRIAAILDTADGIRRKRQQAIAMADEFLRSVFLDMFGDPVTNPKGWKTEKVKNIGNVTTGNTPSRSMPEYYGDEIEWIKSDNINTPSHYLTKATEGLSPKGKAVGRTVGKDAILVTCIAGSPDCIGNLALADREVAFNQQINALETNGRVDTLFMYSQLMVGKKLLQNASTNSMKGMVSKGKFELISVMVPPTNLQLEFSKIFRHQLKTAQYMAHESDQANILFASISQDAFQGTL